MSVCLRLSSVPSLSLISLFFPLFSLSLSLLSVSVFFSLYLCVSSLLSLSLLLSLLPLQNVDMRVARSVGKRACLWLQDLVIDFEELERLTDRLPFRGVKV